MKKLILLFAVLIILFPFDSFSQINITKEQAEEFRQQLQLLQGVQASNFALTDTTGNMVKLEDFRDKLIIIDFWFTSCAPCINEIPYFKKVKALYKDSTNVVFINICIDNIERKPQWKSLINKHKIGGVNLFLPKNREATEENRFYIDEINIFPTYLLVSKAGLILGALPNVESITMPFSISRGFNNKTTVASFDDFLTSNDVFKEWLTLNMNSIMELQRK